MPQTIDVSDLPPTVVEAIEAMVRAYRELSAPHPQRRVAGWAKGVLPDLPDSFFDDLPPDLLDQFEDRTA